MNSIDQAQRIRTRQYLREAPELALMDLRPFVNNELKFLIDEELAGRVVVTFADTYDQQNSVTQIAKQLTAEVASWTRAEYGATGLKFFIGDMNHGDVGKERAFSVCLEGVRSNWPFEWSESMSARRFVQWYGLDLEAVNACVLAVYPW